MPNAFTSKIYSYHARHLKFCTRGAYPMSKCWYTSTYIPYWFHVCFCDISCFLIFHTLLANFHYIPVFLLTYALEFSYYIGCLTQASLINWQAILQFSQCLYSLSRLTSYRKILWSLKASRFMFRPFQSLWNLTGTSAALLPRCLSNFRAIRSL